MPVDMSIPQSIIGAWIQAQQNQRAKEKQVSDIEAQKAETELRKQQFDQQDKMFQYHQKQADLANALAQQQLKLDHAKHMMSVGNAFTLGHIMPNAQVPRSPEQDAQSQSSGFNPGFKLGNETIDLSAFPSPEQAFARSLGQHSQLGNVDVELAGKKAGAEAEAKFPTQAAITNMTIMGNDQRAKLQRDSQEKIAGSRNETELKKQEMADKARIEAAKIAASKRGQGAILDSAAIQTYAEDITKGLKGIDQVEAKYRPFVELAAKRAGFMPITKAKMDTLDSFSGLVSVVNEARKLIPLVPTSGIMSQIKSRSSFTDLSKKLQEITARAGAIVKSPIFANDRGNIALKEVDRALGAVFAPGNTRSDVQEKFQNLINTVNTSFNLHTTGMTPQQKQFYRDKYITPMMSEDKPMSTLRNSKTGEEIPDTVENRVKLGVPLAN